ncbi:replication-relaxation family protein [Nonomuraea sp. NPDC050790]|uniref:replication-relaxation family protein n=1 Tax=Nonomuraea sp. NPDC050790 TaxID=3364371 RepID=UPI00379AF36A
MDWLRERLSPRDWAVIRDVMRLRLMTSRQLERVHFADLTPPSRAVVRRRVLGRLVDWQVLRTLERRIGGVRAGSAGLVFAPDRAAWRLLEGAGNGAHRPKSLPGERYVAHTLDVAAVYAGLVEQARAGGVEVVHFEGEPGSWWPDGRGGVLKPDAYAVVATATYEDRWWIEVDRATESLPTLRRKVTGYLEFVRQGAAGPDGVIPRVLITVPNEKRYSDVVRLIRQLPSPAESLFIVTLHKDAAFTVMRYLQSG